MIWSRLERIYDNFKNIEINIKDFKRKDTPMQSLSTIKPEKLPKAAQRPKIRMRKAATKEQEYGTWTIMNRISIK